MNTVKKTLALGAFSSVLVLSGCMNDANEADNTSSVPAEQTEFGIDANAISAAASDISEEQFAEAFKTYVTNNQDEFGSLVIEAASKVQQEEQAKQQAEQQKLIEEQAKNVPDIRETDHVLGNRDAEFVLFEYSDYHCPYCVRFHPTSKEFLEKNDDVALVFRPYPGVHTQTSSPIHEIAECVAKEAGNDSFWSFTDSAFEKGTSLTPENYQDELAALKIENIDAIAACYESGEFKKVVADSEKEGQSLGIQGTPGSIIKNTKTGEVRFVGGAYPLTELEKFKAELTK